LWPSAVIRFSIWAAVSRVWRSISQRQPDEFFAYLDKYDGRANGQKAVELDQGVVFRFVAIAVKVDLFDSFDGQVFVLEGHLIGVGGESLSIEDDIIGEGRREQDNLYGLWKQPEDFLAEEYVVCEPDSRFDTNALITQALLIKHVVGFIQDENPKLTNIHDTFSNHVLNGAWGANNHGRFDPTRARGGILGNGGFDSKTFHERTHHLHNADNLSGKFSAGCQHQRLRSLLHLLIGKIETV
jgi:hypothetical protein